MNRQRKSDRSQSDQKRTFSSFNKYMLMQQTKTKLVNKGGSVAFLQRQNLQTESAYAAYAFI